MEHLTPAEVVATFGRRFEDQELPLRRDLALPDDSRFIYEPAWIELSEASALYSALEAALSWEERPIVAFGREILQPRLIAWAGELPYRYSGQELPPREEPAVLTALRERVEQASGHRFNHVVGNLYRDGQDHVSMHADNEPELGRCPVVGSVSLGASRRFVIERKANRKKKRFTLHHGSLLVMEGAFQHKWRHEVPKQATASGPRINLTFRWLHGPPGWRQGPPGPGT